MKRVLAIAVLAGVLGACLCGKEEPTGPQRSAYELDTLAVRTILDSSYLTLSATAVTTMELVNGVARVGTLVLPGTVTGGNLTSLPGASLGQLNALTLLTLNNNKIASLPAQIGNLTRLTALDLTSNLLTTLPSQIGSLTALETLKLKGNRLTAIPPEVGQLHALNVLDLDNNQLTELPDALAQITPTPDMVTFDGNRICSLSTTIQQWLAAASLYDPDFKSRQVGCPLGT